MLQNVSMNIHMSLLHGSILFGDFNPIHELGYIIS